MKWLKQRGVMMHPLMCEAPKTHCMILVRQCRLATPAFLAPSALELDVERSSSLVVAVRVVVVVVVVPCPPPPCISYALVPATVSVGTVIIVYAI